MAADHPAWDDKVLPHVRGWSEATPADVAAVAAYLEANLRQQGDAGWELVAALGGLEAAALILKRPTAGGAPPAIGVETAGG